MEARWALASAAVGGEAKNRNQKLDIAQQAGRNGKATDRRARGALIGAGRLA